MAFARVQHFDVPPLPANRLRALELLAQPSVELGELVDIAELDPAMTVALLRMANSASSSPSRRLTTARTAVVRLGSLPTRRVIAGTVLSTSFPQPTPDIIDSGEYWRHALAVALIADAAAVARGSRSEAFTVGLLHDMGCLAMAASEPARYQRVARLVRAGVTERDAEQAIFGHDHAYYGCLVAEQWGLGDSIAEAIGDHHTGTTSELARTVIRARHVAARAGVGDGRGSELRVMPELDNADRALLASVDGARGLTSKIEAIRSAIGMGPVESRSSRSG